MRKLSKCQRNIYNRILSIVTEARSMDYPSWIASDPYFQVPEWLASPLSASYNPSAVESIRKQLKKAIGQEYRKAFYDEARAGIVCASCRNSRTVRKLQEYGLIEILGEGSRENRWIWRVKMVDSESQKTKGGI